MSWRQVYGEVADRAHLQSSFGGLPTLQCILAIAGTVILMGYGLSRRFASYARIPAGFVLSLPLLLMIVPNPSDSILISIALVLVDLVVLVELVLWALRVSTAAPISLTTILLIGLIWGDLSLHGPLLQSALMSYSVMEGARYYGIGNEYGGALIGAILALACMFPRQIVPGVAALGITAVLAGLPQHGAILV